MILDLREFVEFPADVTIKAGPGEIGPFGDSVIRVDEVDLQLAVQQSAKEYFCQGRVSAQVVLECARCLVEFEAEVEGPTDFIVCSADVATGQKDTDSEEYVCFQGNDLRADIVEPVRQALMLSLSMKPLCSDDCRGLCPGCGTNLNQQTCDCENKTTDPRWDGLSDLSPK